MESAPRPTTPTAIVPPSECPPAAPADQTEAVVVPIASDWPPAEETAWSAGADAVTTIAAPSTPGACSIEPEALGPDPAASRAAVVAPALAEAVAAPTSNVRAPPSVVDVAPGVAEADAADARIARPHSAEPAPPEEPGPEAATASATDSPPGMAADAVDWTVTWIVPVPTT